MLTGWSGIDKSGTLSDALLRQWHLTSGVPSFFYEDDRTVESLKTSIVYAEKARDINKSFRCFSDRQFHAIEHLIATATAHLARLEGSDSKMSEAALLKKFQGRI